MLELGRMQCGCTFIEEDDEFKDWDEICDTHSSHLCMDCERHIDEYNEYYMVHDWIWTAATINNEVFGLLCIGCLEDRIGRELKPTDFTGFPVNSKQYSLRRSWRQRMRMGYI